jgi:hypothetical protein
MPTADDFRAELRPQLRAAEIAGKPHVDITSHLALFIVPSVITQTLAVTECQCAAM